MDSSDFTSSNSSQEDTNVNELFKNVNEESSTESLPQGELSSLELLSHAYTDANDKKTMYELGLCSPGSGEVCTKYLAMSDSSIYRHPYYNYPSIKDPGIVDALTKDVPEKIYADDGQELYLDLCKEMNIAPVRMFHRDLLVETVDLSYYGVCTKNVRAMCMALTNNTTVRRIDFTSNFLSNDACYHIGQLLGKNRQIQEIILHQCKIGMEGVRRVVNKLNYRDTDLLDLSSNDLCDEGFNVLAETMIKGAIIKRLNVANNNLGHKSAIVLMEVLEHNNQFTHLDLSWNQLGVVQRGASRLIQTLSESEYLEELNLAFNYITKADTIHLLMRAVNLRHLDLSRNKLQSEAVNNIVIGFHRSKLRSLDLSRNPLTTRDAFTILKAFEKSPYAERLCLDDVDVEMNFVERAARIQAARKVIITHGRIVRDFTIGLTNMRSIVIKRLNVISRSKSKKRPKLDICVYLLDLQRKGFAYIDVKTVLRSLRLGGVTPDEDLIDELQAAFPGPSLGKTDPTVNIPAACDYIRRMFPEKEPNPPTPEPEPEPPVNKGKRAKDAKGKGGKGKKK